MGGPTEPTTKEPSVGSARGWDPQQKPQDCVKRAARGLQEEPRWPQESPRELQEGPKRGPPPLLWTLQLWTLQLWTLLLCTLQLWTLLLWTLLLGILL